MPIGRGFLAKLIIVLAALLIVFLVFNSGQSSVWLSEIAKNPETPQLPYYIFRTMLRMIAAYILVVIFGLVYGIVAGLYEKPRRIMLPLLDILQSIPVLGYLPAAVLFFIYLFPGELGVEVASILLIFTGEAWAVTFGVYGAVRNIPEDLKNVGKAFGLRGFSYMRKLLLPFIFPSFITGSILAWGGGWYFLVACEFMTFGGRIYTLPGIGYYLASSVYVQHSIVSALFGLVVFILLIFAIDKLVWAPLLEFSDKFKVQTLESAAEPRKKTRSILAGLIEFSFDSLADLHDFIIAQPLFKKLQESVRLPALRIGFHKPEVTINPRRMALRNLILFSILFLIVMYFLGLFIAASLAKPLSDIQLSFAKHPEAFSIPLLTLDSILRIFVAYVLALVWTLAAGVIITRSKFLSGIFLPLFDIGQSIPALALFPFIIIIVFKYIGTGETGLETASILLLLTGTQWYLLFNLIGAINRIPGDVKEAASSFGIKDWSYVKYVLLPAIFPGIVLGSIQAWGGAWNATIVSEYINYGGHIPFEMNYSGMQLNNITALVDTKVSTIYCAAGRCSGLLEVEYVGMHNASLELHSSSGNFSIPLTFNVSDIGKEEHLSKPVSMALSGGQVTLIRPVNDSASSLHPYSVSGLGAFISRATAEWGDPWLVTIAIATMSLTIILMNRIVWSYLFKKAERYKFEMT